MSKHKVGDIVKTTQELKDYGRTIPSGTKAKIVSDYGNGWYDIEVDGKVYGHSVKLLNSEVVENTKGADGIEIKRGDRIEWIDHGKHDGVVTLVDYNRIVVDGKYNVDAIDVYHKGKCPFNSRNSVVANALAWKKAACNEAMVEVKRKRSGVKTIVPLSELRKGTEWGKDLTGYERNMIGRGINKYETDEFRYTILPDAKR